MTATDEYVDVFSQKWTNRFKMIAWVRFGLKLLLVICWIILFVTLLQGLAPYIKGTDEWADMPFTLSQLESILTLLFMCWLMKKTIRGLN